jgi:hypothetical protein
VCVCLRCVCVRVCDREREREIVHRKKLPRCINVGMSLPYLGRSVRVYVVTVKKSFMRKLN